MLEKRLYQPGIILIPASKMMGIPLAPVLLRANLPADFFDKDDRRVDAKTYFDLSHSFALALGGPESWLALARQPYTAPLVPPILSFSASENIISGLKRAALFKELCAPISMEINETESSVELVLEALGVDDPKMPFHLAYFEIAVYVHLFRTFTGRHIVPVKVTMPETLNVSNEYYDFIGGPIEQSDKTCLILNKQDAYMPLDNADIEIWSLVEKELIGRMRRLDENAEMSERVRKAIVELLPSGRMTIEVVCSRLCMTRRSLQRKLKGEGTTFQTLLDSTRADLAQAYLKDGLNTEEISYLLAYRDPSSFYRAFHDWTGTTPARARDLINRKKSA